MLTAHRSAAYNGSRFAAVFASKFNFVFPDISRVQNAFAHPPIKSASHPTSHAGGDNPLSVAARTCHLQKNICLAFATFASRSRPLSSCYLFYLQLLKRPKYFGLFKLSYGRSPGWPCCKYVVVFGYSCVS